MDFRLVAGLCAFALVTPVLAQDNTKPMKAEVLHWWTSASESAAIGVFRNKFTAEGGEWIDNAIAGANAARQAGLNRIVGGNPTTAMQFNLGKQFDELVSNGLIRNLEDQAGPQKWRDLMVAPIVRGATRDGKFYALPVNVNGGNWLFYNKKVLQDAGVKPPATFTELVETGKALQSKGIIPIAFAGTPLFEHIVFRAVIAGHAGPAVFKRLYGDRDLTVLDEPKFREAVDLYSQMRALADPGSPGRSWNEAASLVITGKAAMHINGSFAKGEFTAAGQTAGKEYDCALVGENGGTLLVGSDVFVFPASDDKAVIAAQDALMKAMFDPTVQLEFNKKKGSSPSRMDIDVASMDSCTKKERSVLADEGHIVEASDLLATPGFSGAMQDVVTQFWNGKGITSDDFIGMVKEAIQSAD